MRSRFAILLAVAAVCVTAAFANWTSESLVTGSPDVWRTFHWENCAHRVVFGTDGVGHLVWHGGPYSDGHPGVWYNRYNPGSGSQPGYWGADFAVAPYTKKKGSMFIRNGSCVALDGDGRTIHVVWIGRRYPGTGDSVYYRKCTQDRRGKDKWGAQFLLAANQLGTYSCPVVACVPSEPNHVLVCWRNKVDLGTGGYGIEISFREYVNGAWAQVVHLDTSVLYQTTGPAIAVAGNGDVFVAYDDGTSGPQVFVKTRTDGVWGEPVNVTESFSSLYCYRYTIEVNPTTNNPHVVFERIWEVPNDGGLDTLHAVYHTYRNASGDWLTPPELILEPHSYGFSPRPTMAFDCNGAAHVVWHDSVSPTSNGIMYSYCSSEEGAWSTPELLAYISYQGQFITVEQPANTIHVVWGRPIPGLYDSREIWWKSNYLGGVGGQAQPVALPQSSIELFPNPAKAGRITVNYALPHEGPMTATLLDVSGRAVRRLAFGDRRSVEGSFALDVRGLNAGVYILKLDAGATSQTRKLVIQ